MCSPTIAWSAYWLPIFQALAAQCTNACREVRHLAFSSLQRSLLSPELISSRGQDSSWTAIFGEVLFPLIRKLLRPEVFTSDRDGMSETRVQTASLLCKVFLQYLVLLSQWDGLLDLWLQIIDILDRLMNSGQGDSLVSFCYVSSPPTPHPLFRFRHVTPLCRNPDLALKAGSRLSAQKGIQRKIQNRLTNLCLSPQEEAVPENLKNVLLFMSSSGYLVPPSKDPAQEKLWSETWRRIDRFLPDLRADLQLEEEVPPVPVPEKEEKGEETQEKEKGGVQGTPETNGHGHGHDANTGGGGGGGESQSEGEGGGASADKREKEAKD